MTTTVDSSVMAHDDVADLVSKGLQHPSVRHFHAHWYHQKTTWAMTRYRGVPTLKCPLDLQIYHEMIWQLRPAVVIETGTCFGGSALWFADQLNMVHGVDGHLVISIDIEDRRTPPPDVPNQWVRPDRYDIRWIIGDSSDPEIVAMVGRMSAGVDTMVVLDSDHTKAHVLSELDAYAPMVSSGQYLVVEDTNISGRPLTCPDDPGPGAALDEWIPNHPEFEPDVICERNLLTMHPGGWLRRG